MSRVAILTFSDGRDSVRSATRDFCAGIEEQIARVLGTKGHSAIRTTKVIGDSEDALAAARAVAAERPDLTIFNLPVWAFPHFPVMAARECQSPILLFSNLNPEYPGMVGMLAAAGALDQMGRKHGRAWGDIEDPNVLERVETFVRVATAIRALEGSTFGRVGGRSMGMYTAVANSQEWSRKFGINVEEIDQWELVRRSEGMDRRRLVKARKWLERYAAGVHYDGKLLTPERLERQIGAYYAMRELVEEWHLAFSGIKGQPELTDHFATMDITEAFLNDPYDWDGPKETHVCATEADMDGALTMQLLKSLSGTPVLFSDMRHYHSDRGIWDLCNSGQHPTWFAARSGDATENLKHVHLYPEGFYFPAGGASVHHVAAPGDFTFARLTRKGERYRMQVMRGSLERYDDVTNDALMRMSTYEWPHAFARFAADASTILSRYGSNHIHAVPGDYVEELRILSDWMDVDFEELGTLS